MSDRLTDEEVRRYDSPGWCEPVNLMARELLALREALRPFAAMAKHYKHRGPAESILSATPERHKWVHITAADLFRAAALLEPLP